MRMTITMSFGSVKNASKFIGKEELTKIRKPDSNYFQILTIFNDNNAILFYILFLKSK